MLEYIWKKADTMVEVRGYNRYTIEGSQQDALQYLYIYWKCGWRDKKDKKKIMEILYFLMSFSPSRSTCFPLQSSQFPRH
jgi:hypothetical protein